MTEFEMSNLGRLAYFIGLEFVTTSRIIVLHQKKYVSDVLKRFNMADYNPATTPAKVSIKLDNINEDDKLVDSTLFKQLVGSLRYICNST